MNPELIRETIDQVLADPAYDLDDSRFSYEIVVRWIIEALRYLLKPLSWLLDSLSGLPEGLRWVLIITLFLSLILLISHIILSVIRALRTEELHLALEQQTSLTPDDYEQRAAKAFEQQDYLFAIRSLFRAALLRLENREERRFRPGTTNREHAARLAGSPSAESFTKMVQLLDRTWYGLAPCTIAEYLEFSNSYETFRQRIVTPG